MSNSSKPKNSEIMKRTIRERLIHLLAVRPYKKPELLLRMYKDRVHEKDKKHIVVVLREVSECKNKVFELKRTLWIDVCEDWPFYSELDRAKLRKRKPQNLISKSAINRESDVAIKREPEVSIKRDPDMSFKYESDLAIKQESDLAIKQESDLAIKKNSEIMKRTIRERLIHLLALRPYKKPELLLRMYKDCVQEKDKKHIVVVLREVSECKNKVFELKGTLWIDVCEDWPFYSELDRAKLRKRKPQNLISKSVIKRESDVAIKREPEVSIKRDPDMSFKRDPDMSFKHEPDLAIKQESDLAIKQESDLAIKKEPDLTIKGEFDLVIKREYGVTFKQEYFEYNINQEQVN